ncbi:MAG: peptide chain release factor 3 [Candidatus Methylomirabilota bacterium]
MKTAYAREIEKRRTFGIISHPDAGKTTLTEKLLLYGGAIQLAGMVKAKKNSRYATSDWLAIERERGISVTTSVMKFDYQGYALNLLDTPGHQDFSEDTYRVLTAVDSALMVIDHARGVETQTEKLMEVCRMRNIPIITFINKLDTEGPDPFEVLREIEEKLQIECVPFSWPIGMGKLFKGVYDVYNKGVKLFQPSSSTRQSEEQAGRPRSDHELDDLLKAEDARKLRGDIELLRVAGNPYERKRFLTAGQTPVFFGSALNNFGVQELLDTFVAIAPCPQPRSTTTRLVSPDEETFSGFTFKVQANMDPLHRDRMAFVRICSGKFTKGMKVRHHRTGKDLKLSNAMMFMAQDRHHIEEAYPGDIIGIYNHGTIKIGDTFTDKEPLKFTGIPNFAPGFFGKVILRNPIKRKQLQKGLRQLAEEGAIQLLHPLAAHDDILGAVGNLQFDVTKARLKDEYGVDATYERLDYAASRWIACESKSRLEEFTRKMNSTLCHDLWGGLVYLAPSLWWLDKTRKEWPDIRFLTSHEHA